MRRQRGIQRYAVVRVPPRNAWTIPGISNRCRPAESASANGISYQRTLIPAIGERLQQAEYDVLFLSGIGEVFPYIRSHNVLNNLQSTAKDKPT